MLKAFFAAVVLVFASLFGMHHAQPAAVAPVTIVQSPSVHSLSVPSLSVAAIALTPTLSAPAITPATIRSTPATAYTGLVLGTSTSASDTVTHAELNAALNQLGNSLRSQFFSITSSGPSFSGPAASTPVSFQTFATSQNIDQLSGVTISNSTVHGLSGLTVSDIPSLSGTYMSLNGGTISGAASFLGKVAIGTTTAATQFDVVGQIPAAPLSQISATSPRSIVVQDKYLYVASPGMLQIFDISNAAAPALVGSTVTTQGSGHDLFVTGSLAIITDGNNNVSIVDVSNPSHPAEIYTSGGLGSSFVGRVAIQGKYLYVVGSAQRTLSIWDISNPRGPRLVGTSAALPSSVYSEVFIEVQGNYAYLTTNTDLTIADVSNPAAPVLRGTVNIGGSVQSIRVDGRYAYLANQGSGALDIVDVASTSAPSLVSAYAVGGGPFSLVKQGRYVYLADYVQDEIKIIDVSNPTSPSWVGSVATGVISWGSRSLAVQGHYAFQAINGSNLVQVFDLGGAYVQSLDAGTVQATDLSVSRDLQVGHNLSLRGGITVAEGFNSSAASAVFASTTDSALTVTQNFTSGAVLKLYGGTNNLFTVQASGNVGIGTTTPYSRLSVWGPDTASTSAFAVVNNASTTVFSVYDNGNATYSGSMFQSSDARLKTNVEGLDASSSLAAIEALNPVSYTRLDQPGQGQNLGFLAQAVQAIFPELVSTTSATALTPDGTLTLNYVGLISPIVSAIQALDSEITTLASTVSGFAQNFATQTLVADNGTFKQITTDKLCVTKSDGSPVCITGDGLDQILTNENVSPASSATPAVAPPELSSSTASSSPDTASSISTTTIEAPSIVPDYTASTTLPASSEATTSPAVEEATSTQ